MDHFDYRDRTLFCEDVPVPELAEKYGTPLYVYSQTALLDRLKEVQDAFAEAKPVICYSVKANGNLSLCRVMGQAGAGFDVTSQGEFQRAESGTERLEDRVRGRRQDGQRDRIRAEERRVPLRRGE